MSLSFEFLRRMSVIALGGALGTACRFLVTSWATKQFGYGYPWGTSIVNLLGSLLFGLIWAATERSEMAVPLRMLLLTGFMGAFTTFSTFMFESVQLLQADRPQMALLNLFVQNLLGVGCIYGGLMLGRSLPLGH